MCVKYNYGESWLEIRQCEDNSSQFRAAADSSLASKTNQRSRRCLSPELVAVSRRPADRKYPSKKTRKPNPTGKCGESFLLNKQHRLSDHNRRPPGQIDSAGRSDTDWPQTSSGAERDDTCRPSGGITTHLTAPVHLEMTGTTRPQNAYYFQFFFPF